MSQHMAPNGAFFDHDSKMMGAHAAGGQNAGQLSNLSALAQALLSSGGNGYLTSGNGNGFGNDMLVNGGGAMLLNGAKDSSGASSNAFLVGSLMGSTQAFNNVATLLGNGLLSDGNGNHASNVAAGSKRKEQEALGDGLLGSACAGGGMANAGMLMGNVDAQAFMNAHGQAYMNANHALMMHANMQANAQSLVNAQMLINSRQQQANESLSHLAVNAQHATAPYFDAQEWSKTRLACPMNMTTGRLPWRSAKRAEQLCNITFRKRQQVQRACKLCRMSKLKCDDVRPCSRCIRRGVENTCESWVGPSASPTAPGTIKPEAGDDGISVDSKSESFDRSEVDQRDGDGDGDGDGESDAATYNNNSDEDERSEEPKAAGKLAGSKSEGEASGEGEHQSKDTGAVASGQVPSDSGSQHASSPSKSRHAKAQAAAEADSVGAKARESEPKTPGDSSSKKQGTKRQKLEDASADNRAAVASTIDRCGSDSDGSAASTVSADA